MYWKSNVRVSLLEVLSTNTQLTNPNDTSFLANIKRLHVPFHSLRISTKETTNYHASHPSRHQPSLSFSRSARHHDQRHFQPLLHVSLHSLKLPPRPSALTFSPLPPTASPPQTTAAPTRFSLRDALFLRLLLLLLFLFWQAGVRGMVSAHARNLPSHHQKRNLVACVRRVWHHFSGTLFQKLFSSFLMYVWSDDESETECRCNSFCF